ncbi:MULTISPECIES: AMP-binding protein [Brevibacillus]|jgi:Acyl-CoA synthetases (AMP-forming)/AMP-acid ligases II|uniref:AMP-binding protein n=1 Tax=Brevibacillus TaxID=55080 RepID=UPI000EE73912|nr:MULTISPECIES: AMP-binding protein [Brevibacillus]MBU8713079.1 AMP-binding protein [Brevibacillus parabrevis]MDR5002252.1 AMP-binding protein [Brevibacillus parabrevis]MED2256309.1 AMP-binding protein [Brevibacillus parabrevis]WDV96953.1 AMP-binding protein [Brevibacillus parabrevis]HBZ82399.1 long-chain fatty acid--CoA ligase [Brevibacillus sp.]
MSNAKPWIANYPSETAPSLDYPRIPLTQFLVQSAASYPDNNAIYFMGKTISYRELLELSYRFANALVERGVQKGERVAIMLPNTPQAVISYYGVLFAGATVVMTNPLYTERELIHQLEDSGAQTIITLDLLYKRVAQVRSSTPLKRIFVTSIGDFLPLLKKWLYPLVQKKQGHNPQVTYGADVEPFLSVIKESAVKPVQVPVDPDKDIALLQYTGGTTGVAKGVMLTHANLIANAIQCQAVLYKLKKGGERILGVLPLFHVYGMTTVMNKGICIAAEIILVPKFEVKQIFEMIDKRKPTLFPGAPTMYIALINHPDLKNHDLSSIDACVSGSAPLPIEVKLKFEELTGGKLVEGYGLTEASPVTHSNPIWEKSITGSIGMPWPDTDCRIIDTATGEELPQGEIGELAVKGPQVMLGYWNRPEDTAAVLKDGWLLTGDVGYMDENGYFYIVDRKKDMIIAGGFNIYPREVEEVLFEHPAIQEAAVIGVPDPYRGETVKAFIVFKDGKQASEEELEAHCRQKLAAYKIPRKYEVRTELPKTMVGKVLRRQLQEEDKARRETQEEIKTS